MKFGKKIALFLLASSLCFLNCVNIFAEEQEQELELVSPNDEFKTSAEENQEKDGPLTIYVSGIDTRSGQLVEKSLSDVNIIATINPDTKEFLLVNTPRDYYVPLARSNGVRDKLTHAGIYGVQESIATLEMLYDIKMDYYVRVNFGGFTDIIDALGGVTVHSDYNFSTGGYSFVEGDNQLDGTAALAFARERYSFGSGDRQRGKNQMEVIKAVMKKATSPATLLNLKDIIQVVEDNTDTNMSLALATSLVMSQIGTSSDWNINSYSVDGTGDKQIPYSMNQYAYVMVPDMQTVEQAKTYMAAVRNGEHPVFE